MPTVLIVEDDDGARSLATEALDSERYRLLEADTVERARQLLAAESVDLVVLDLGLPDSSGLDLLDDVRDEPDVGVVITTGRDRLEDRIVGLRLGADDYLVKPYAPAELDARVEAVLRRRWPVDRRRILHLDALSIDRAAREARGNGQLIELSPMEFNLLAFLAERPRRAYSREKLLEEVWDSSSQWQVESTVTEHVRKLRRKLNEATDRPWITTVRGVGYRFDP